MLGHFLLLLCVDCQHTTRQNSVPLELLAARENRNFAAGEVLWSYQGVSASDGTPFRIRRAIRFNGNAFIVREKSPGVTYNIWFDGDKYWSNHDNSTMASVRAASGLPVWDARTLGMNPFGVIDGGLDKLVSDPVPYQIDRKEYSVEQDGPYRLVSTYGYANNGTVYTLRQWIDPKRDFNIVRSQVERDGDGILYESISVLKRYGDKWFPSTVVLYRPEIGPDPVATITVEKATFDDSVSQTSFRPEDIGIEIGTNVYVFDSNGVRGDVLSWDGSKLEPFGNVARRVNKGELELGPRLAAERAERRAGNLVRRYAKRFIDEKFKSSGLSRKAELHEWEVYISHFIAFYSLGDAQSNKAWDIYKGCRAQADRHLKKTEEGRAQLERRLRSVREAPSTSNQQERIVSIATAKAALDGPIVAIFKKQLQPRLRSLLTRKQSAKGEMP